MGNIRSEYKSKLTNDLRLQPGANDQIINDVSKILVPTYNISTPYQTDVVRHLFLATTTSATTIYTPSANKTFYLTYIELSNQSNATADNTQIYVRSSGIDGTQRFLIGFAKLTTTAFSDSICIEFASPIPITNGQAIQLVNAFTVGASNTFVVIGGYEIGN